MTRPSNGVVTVVLTRMQLFVAALMLTGAVLANIVAVTMAFTEVREMSEGNSLRIDKIETTTVPSILAQMAHLEKTQMQLIEIRVNLQALMRRQGIPYESVLRQDQSMQ